MLKGVLERLIINFQWICPKLKGIVADPGIFQIDWYRLNLNQLKFRALSTELCFNHLILFLLYFTRDRLYTMSRHAEIGKNAQIHLKELYVTI